MHRDRLHRTRFPRVVSTPVSSTRGKRTTKLTSRRTQSVRSTHKPQRCTPRARSRCSLMTKVLLGTVQQGSLQHTRTTGLLRARLPCKHMALRMLMCRSKRTRLSGSRSNLHPRALCRCFQTCHNTWHSTCHRHIPIRCGSKFLTCMYAACACRLAQRRLLDVVLFLRLTDV